MTMRRFLLAGGLLALALALLVWQLAPARAPLPVLPPGAPAADAHIPFGPVRPAKPLPAVMVTAEGGKPLALDDMLRGHWTVAQFIFTGCSTTCPVQGAIFAETQQRLTAASVPAELLSISIDTLGDTPQSLADWLARFGAGPHWRAAIPEGDGLAKLFDLMGGRGTGVDLHDARVYVFQPDGKLVYVTEEMPDPAGLARLVGEAQQAGPQP